MSSARCLASIAMFTLFALGLLLPRTALSQTIYSYTWTRSINRAFADSKSTAINAQGEICGTRYATYTSPPNDAMLWDTPFGVLNSVGVTSRAVAISDFSAGREFIAGYTFTSSSTNRGCVWTVDAGDNFVAALDMGLVSNGTYSDAYGVNAAGWVVGSANNGVGYRGGKLRAFRTMPDANGNPQAITNAAILPILAAADDAFSQQVKESAALGVDEAGDAVGWSGGRTTTVSFGRHACFWPVAGAPVDLHSVTPAGKFQTSAAIGVSSDGTCVAGYVEPVKSTKFRAGAWINANGQWRFVDLQALMPNNTAFSVANAIQVLDNGNIVAVGTYWIPLGKGYTIRGFSVEGLEDEGSTFNDLTSRLVPNNDNLVILQANGINVNGLIAGWARTAKGSGGSACLLTPAN